MWSFVAPLLAAVVFTAPAAPATPDPSPSAAAHRAVAQAESVLEDATTTAQIAVQRYEAANEALPAAQQRVATTRGLVAAARAASDDATRQADSASTAYAAVAKVYDGAQQQVQTAQDQVDRIAQASYMGSEFEEFNMLIEGSGPSDEFDRLALVQQVMRSQRQDVQTYVGARRAVAVARDRAGLAERQAEDTAQAAKDKLDAATAAQVQAVQAVQAVRKIAANRLAAVRLATSQRAAVLARYRAAQADEVRIESSLRSAAVHSGAIRYTGGLLLTPVHGWKSSGFGERYDPYYHVWQLHAGTDIAAPGGTPIRAAAAGRVVRAGWDGGYGRYTCIDHGRINGTDFSTCYGHQSAFLVHVGEYVERGQVIGRVGATGAATGDHLHFETRFNGVPKNPLPYLPACLC